MGILGSGGRWICVRVAGEALDVGCGDGDVATLLEREGHRVVTVDAERAGGLPFDDESFDTVLLGDFLAEWASRERPIAEARRVLRPGGRLIVAAAYVAGQGENAPGVSLAGLLGELGEFSVGEIATVEGKLCLVAERRRERGKAAVWRRALGVAEGRLAENDAAIAALSASVAELAAGREREERALANARGDVERLEMALAGATHRRDLEQEKARLAGEGVAKLEQRLERLQHDSERERAEAERELERQAADAERKLAQEVGEAERRREQEVGEAERKREQEVGQAEGNLAEARVRLEERQEELERGRAAAQEAKRELVALRERLGESGRDLAVKERELGHALEELVGRERELDLAEKRLVDRQHELEVAGALLETKAAELDEVREIASHMERERDEVRARLELRERHLKTAQLGVESRDRKLAATDRALESRDSELERLRATTREHGRKLALAEARLEKAQQRAEHFRGSLVALREGRAYRLMRVVWWLRRPFKRAPREAAVADARASDDADPAPPADRLRVASILDEMSAACFAPECDLVPLNLEGWREQLDEHRPDLLLVESAWNGNGGEWQYRIAEYPRKDLVGLPALRALLDGCHERGIPTAFWNKEDPVHFERFAEAASLFDHVFTTDARCVEAYRALPGERTVDALPFAAQPRIHNPVAAVPERSASPCFAGAWYRDRHPDRRQSLEALLDAARPYGLVIYDRRFGGDDAAFGFPERFAPHVLGKLPYERILDVYKSHRVFLNANSVADSPTMCSRRVFELAASDTAILSTPGAALAALLGDGLVEEAGDGETAAVALERLLGDEGERTRRIRAARRVVFAEHTYAERLATIAATAGIDTSSLRREPFAPPGASANGAAASPNGAGDTHPWTLVLQPGVTLSEAALADFAAATAFADADVIGTRPAHNGDSAVEHQRVADLDPRALLLRRELVESRGRPAGSAEQVRAQLREWNEDNVHLFAADADLLSARESRPLTVRSR